MSSDLDQLVYINPVPLRNLKVRGDLDQLIVVTSVSLRNLGIWRRCPPPPLSPSHSSSDSVLQVNVCLTPLVITRSGVY